jgi:hypothetical protein
MKTLLCLLLISCNTQNGSTPTQSGKPVTLPAVVVEAPPPSITIKGTADQVARMTRIIAEVDNIVASKEFGDAVMAHTYLGKPGFASTGNTPPQVLQDARSGAEKTMGLTIEFKRHRSDNVTAWTYPTSKVIWFNSTRLGRDDASVAQTFAHECQHKIGYGHDAKPTKRRPYSQPYVLGSIVKRLYKERHRELGKP